MAKTPYIIIYDKLIANLWLVLLCLYVLGGIGSYLVYENNFFVDSSFYQSVAELERQEDMIFGGAFFVDLNFGREFISYDSIFRYGVVLANRFSSLGDYLYMIIAVSPVGAFGVLGWVLLSSGLLILLLARCGGGSLLAVIFIHPYVVLLGSNFMQDFWVIIGSVLACLGVMDVSRCVRIRISMLFFGFLILMVFRFGFIPLLFVIIFIHQFAFRKLIRREKNLFLLAEAYFWIVISALSLFIIYGARIDDMAFAEHTGRDFFKHFNRSSLSNIFEFIESFGRHLAIILGIPLEFVSFREFVINFSFSLLNIIILTSVYRKVGAISIVTFAVLDWLLFLVSPTFGAYLRYHIVFSIIYMFCSDWIINSKPGVTKELI